MPDPLDAYADVLADKIAERLAERLRLPAAAAPERPYLSVKQAAPLLNLSERSVWSLIKRGDLTVARLGRRVSISREAIARYHERREKVERLQDRRVG